jgi:hypothetical protein
MSSGVQPAAEEVVRAITPTNNSYRDASASIRTPMGGDLSRICE